MSARFFRLAETGRATIHFFIDGRAAEALEGDTLLVAMLSAARSVRTSEFGDDKRAGFCLMGACQDCWVWTAQGQRLRACSIQVAAGMQIVTENTETVWLNNA